MDSSTRCVGRGEQIEDLLTMLRSATSPRSVILRGRTGIGKTTLLLELARRHRENHGDTAVLWATGAPWDSQSPGAVARQLTGLDAEDDPTVPVPSMDASRPILIVVDDAEHADDASLFALTTHLRVHRDLPVLLVLATATHDEPVPGLIAEQVWLTGLSGAGIAEIADRYGVALHPAMVERLTAHTGGAPRDVIALLVEVPVGVWGTADTDLPAPQYVAEDVSDVLRGLAPPTRALVETLAILDDHEPFDVVVGHAGLEHDILETVDDACATGLVVVGGGLGPASVRPRLASSMVRSAVQVVMGLASVSRAHQRAAEIVSDPARRLYHLVESSPTVNAKLADDLARLARERGVDGAWAEAAGLFRQAGRLTAEPLLRDTRITLAVDALLAAGDCIGAAAQISTVESLRETPLRNATLAYLAILRGRAAESQVRLERAWGIVNADREPGVAAFIAQRNVLHGLARCQGEDLVHWADQAITLAGSGSSEAVEAAVIRGLGLAWSGRPVQAQGEYTVLADRIRFGAQTQRVSMGRGWLQLGTDEISAARGSLSDAVAMSGLGGSDRISLWALAWLARAHFVTGEWDEALGCVARGRAMAASSGIELVTPLLNWTAVQVHSLRGDWDQANSLVRGITGGADEYEIMRIPDLLARAQIAEASADYAAVCRILEPLQEMAPEVPALRQPGWWPWVDVLANAMVIDGRLDAADALLGEYEAITADAGHRSASARLKYARGRHLGAIGDIHGARRVFTEALELLDGLPLRWDRARVTFTYGQTLRRAGKRRAADTVIGTARDIYRSMGADTYVERCERELKAGGVHAVRADRGRAELTPQEEAVTALVASGMSNREVAAELYISPKTVQYHLTRIYAKLSIRSRSELAARMRDDVRTVGVAEA